MSWIQNLPIKRTISLVIVLTCSLVLLLACLILAGYEVFEFRGALVRDTSALADVLAKNSRGALAFQDEAAARDTLSALQSEPQVSAAALYAADGSRFADYGRAGHSLSPARPEADGHRFDRGGLVLFRPVLVDGRRTGTIFLRSDLSGMYQRLKLFGAIAGLVLIGSILVAFALSSRLQRPISRPILALAEIARIVAEEKDYSVRAAPQGRSEAGRLTDAFNQMLAGIDEREHALRAANDTLRGEVAERKSAEDRARGQLAQLELLHRITRAISERQDLASIFQVVIRTLEDHFPIDLTCVGVCEQAGNILTITNVGVRTEALALELGMSEQSRIDILQNGLEPCIRGRLIYEPDISQSNYPFSQRLARSGLRSLVAAPLLAESRVFGVLVAARRQADGFTSVDCEFLRQLSEHVALAAHQAQLYAALQQAYDDLRQSQQTVMQQERLRALGQMASGIAHDINNAISPVALYTESLLENEPNLSPRARDYLGTIQHAIEDVAQTVLRMREFYRQGETQLTLAPVQLNRLVQQVLDLSRAKWSDMPQQRGVMIKMETDLAADLPAVMGVESEIREALVNLIFNAVDAMPDGGTLSLRTVAPGGSRGPTKPGGAPAVRIEVSDTGIGMDEDTRRRCLEPFFTTKGERGTGLGLAMVYGIVQRHGADIDIQSEPGRGTTFSLLFSPAPTGAGEIPDAKPEAAARERLRILLVDDDPLLIKSLRDTLETEGHAITTANGGQAGIDAFRQALARGQTFDAVITDLGMPYVDGRKVSSAVKDAAPDMPVILLTGWGQRLVAEGDIPPHVDQVLNKPPKLRELREALANRAKRRAAPSQPAT